MDLFLGFLSCSIGLYFCFCEDGLILVAQSLKNLFMMQETQV